MSQALAGSAGVTMPHTNYPATFVTGVANSALPLSSPGRKRSRCDSLGQEYRPPEKISRGYDDTDTDTEMDSLLYSPSNSPSNSPPPLVAATVPQAVLIHRKASKRDESYYFEDGSCVLLVENTLFNVHRSILSRDSSSFGSMFSLPQGDNAVEGRSDDNPIILIGDTPDEFRNFLWALYALPPELSAVTSPSGNLNHLIDIGRVSNKYSFKSLETWALDAIQDYVNRNPSPILPMPPSNSHKFSSLGAQQVPTQAETADQLTRLIRLAQLCSHERLLATMIGLLRQLMTSSVQYAYLAMKLSDELDLRTLRGAAYLEVMQKAVVVKKVRVDVLKSPVASSGNVSNLVAADATGALVQHQAEEGTFDDEGRLIVSRVQQLRLLSGYYRLTSTWDKLRPAPLHFEHSHSCGATWHQQSCTQAWLEFWKETTRSDSVMNLGLADVLGRLKLVQKDYDRWGSATYMHHDCRMNAKKAIADVIRRVEDALPDYFAEPGGFGDD